MAWTANASTEVAARDARVVKRTTEEIIVLRLRLERLYEGSFEDVIVMGIGKEESKSGVCVE